MHLTEPYALSRSGRFLDALKDLDAVPATPAERIEADVLRVHLCERLGEYSRSRYLAERLLRGRSLSPLHQSDCRFALGLIDWDEGRFDRAIEQFQDALTLARAGGDPFRSCWIQLRLMAVNGGRVSAPAAATLIAQARLQVTCLGDPLVSAALHVLSAEIAVKHGALRTARRLTLLGLRLLESTPNLWLQALASNNLVGLALLDSNFEEGLVHATAACRYADASGAAAVRRACMGNMGNLYLLDGALDKARELYERASAPLQTDGEYCHAVVESVARVHLLEGRLDAARACLDAIDAAVRSRGDATLYAHRHSQLTRAVVLQQEGRWDEALAQTAVALELAERSGDRLLHGLCQLARAEILGSQARHDELIPLLDSLTQILPTLPVELLGHYERVLACTLAVAGEPAHRAHFGRAERVFDGLRHRPGQMELHRARGTTPPAVGSTAGEARPGFVEPAHGTNDPIRQAGTILQDITAMLLHAGRPELVATDLVAILAGSGSMARVAAVARHGDGHVEHLASHALPVTGIPVAALPPRTYALGHARDRAIEVVCEPRQDIESVATMNAVSMLLTVVRDLEHAHIEREERLGLWPVEELPVEGDDAVISGTMRDVMHLVRKVAPTGASVLITGESGTGKEIVARAVHKFSNRPGKPFVPFNCTAVPRDLMESQLFGYRRGAFTGAERDHPGLVRAAKDGTLFLDEVGELSLDLQPKLLRFLESGEITPLGESEVITVNTRVVAATNANLERLVHEGRFRADLFYRLQVIPIAIPPLRERRDEIPYLARHFVARAAVEFGKGHLRIDDEAMELLVLHGWPGNVRQLNNELRRIVALSDPDSVLTPTALSPGIGRGRLTLPRTGERETVVMPESSLGDTLARVERQMIESALKKHRGRLDATARALGISRKGLYLKRQRLGL